MIKCPYCYEDITQKNVIDRCHANLQGDLHKKSNTRNIYCCFECGEVFEGRKRVDVKLSVIMYFERPFQYLRSNLGNE